MSKKIEIPELDCQQYLIIQDSFCDAARKRCKDVHCSECLYYKTNIDHFARFFELKNCHGNMKVKK